MSNRLIIVGVTSTSRKRGTVSVVPSRGRHSGQYTRRHGLRPLGAVPHSPIFRVGLAKRRLPSGTKASSASREARGTLRWVASEDASTRKERPRPCRLLARRRAGSQRSHGVVYVQLRRRAVGPRPRARSSVVSQLVDTTDQRSRSPAIAGSVRNLPKRFIGDGLRRALHSLSSRNGVSIPPPAASSTVPMQFKIRGRVLHVFGPVPATTSCATSALSRKVKQSSRERSLIGTPGARRLGILQSPPSLSEDLGPWHVERRNVKAHWRSLDWMGMTSCEDARTRKMTVLSSFAGRSVNSATPGPRQRGLLSAKICSIASFLSGG